MMIAKKSAMWLFLSLVPLIFLTLAENVAAVQEQSEEAPERVQVDATNLSTLENQMIDVRLTDGQLQAFLEVTRLKEGDEPGTLKTLTVKPRGGTRQITLSASKIDEIFVDQQPLDVVYDTKERHLIHSPEKKEQRIAHEQEVAARLKSSRDRLWQPLTDQQQETFLEGQQEFLKKVEETMSNVAFRKVETEFFLIFTDMAPREVDGYIVYLDAMYRQLCKSFGLSDQRNIWCGKCVVIAFLREEDYLTFEASLMDNPNAKGSQGLCHSYGNGEVRFAGFRGEGDYFGSVLVHETTHGFVHRYLSSARIPSWINEGVSDWIAHAVTRGRHVPAKQKASAQFVVKAGGWGDFLTTDRISFDHYGTASTMVDILLANDNGGQFREYFTLMKEGKDPEESLKDTFGISYEDLKIAYAQRISRMK